MMLLFAFTDLGVFLFPKQCVCGRLRPQCRPPSERPGLAYHNELVSSPYRDNLFEISTLIYKCQCHSIHPLYPAGCRCTFLVSVEGDARRRQGCG
ncbi:hypothetical protein BDW60DRAFT_194675 [Aspergillus nidulans var. acristatus]